MLSLVRFPSTVGTFYRSQSFSSSFTSSSALYCAPPKGSGTPQQAYCSLRLPELSADRLELLPQSPPPQEPIKGDEEDPFSPTAPPSKSPSIPRGQQLDSGDADDDEEISGIQVPRQRHIPVSKSELLESIALKMFRSQEDADLFLLVSSCLDSILHAEYKSILEDMRIDYSLADFQQNDGSVNEAVPKLESEFGNMERYENYAAKLDQITPSVNGIDPHVLPAPKNVKRRSCRDSRVASATRFQHAFMQLLHDAQFEELSARDLMLTSVLNSDYLLNLPIYVDWKRASQSNAIIFRRGYATEQQKGVLIVEKLDYIQAKILKGIFSVIAKPLMKVFRSVFQTREMGIWSKRIESWLKQMPFFKQAYLYNEQTDDGQLEADRLSENDLPIWLAAQRAITRYEGLLSPVGPRGRLLRKFLTWVGLVPPTPETPFGLDTGHIASEPYLRPIFLPRISLSDIWRPARKKGSDVWNFLRNSISIILSQSVLQEPAFQELILLYTEEISEIEANDDERVPFLRLKIYEKIPIPDLPVIFPHKKLSFRIIDTIRLDAATILGLLAFFVNNKFEDILSSPSAVLLDVIATSALVLFVTRVVLGYKQTADRYQLLVNRTLYEKTLASGFGSVHFLLDASEQQLYKEAILAYAILLTMEKGQVACPRTIGDNCERFMYEVFKEKVEMPIDKAVGTLRRLGLVAEGECNGNTTLRAIPSPDAYHALTSRWNRLLH